MTGPGQLCMGCMEEEGDMEERLHRSWMEKTMPESPQNLTLCPGRS